MIARLPLVALAVPLVALAACGGPRTSDSVDGDDVDGGHDIVSGCAGGAARECVGDEVHECTADGEIGGLIETCDDGCAGGACQSACATDGVDKVYVVTQDRELLRFDPDALPASGSADAAFSSIGLLDCPAGPALPSYDPLQGEAGPFSMSVDRDGNAWVLYASGEIFLASIEDAACEASGFTPQQEGFELFGMGFVSDEAGGDSETLFIAGSRTDDLGLPTDLRLGSIDKATTRVTPIGAMAVSEYGPELTGTGDAELWGYFPGGFLEGAYVAPIDRATAAVGTPHEVGSLDGAPAGWAFAQYGGKFYLFISHTNLLGTVVPEVKVLDPSTDTVTTYATDNVIVGAGVSTCAPSGPVG